MSKLDTSSIPCRAWRDTQKWLLDSILGWAIAILACAVLSAIFVPEPIGATIINRALWGFTGCIVAILGILAITYAVFLWVTPIRQRDEARNLSNSLNNEIVSLTSQRFEISLPTPDILEGRNGVVGEWRQEWFRIEVHNPTSVPITNCYGRLIEFNSKLPYPNLPTPGIMFPWSSYGAGGKLANIAGHDSEFLDVIVFNERIIIVILDEDSNKRNITRYALINDDYDLVIQIGSQDSKFLPNKIKISVKIDIENFKPKLNVSMTNV
jgi:hypothetical protein